MDNTLSMIGLALRAGRLEVGDEAAGDACRYKRCRLLLVAADAGEGAQRRAMHFAEEGQCLLAEIPCSKEELGAALGRKSCAMAAVTDLGLAQAIVQKLAQEALFPHAPAVITGDLNAEPGSPEMSALRTSPYRNVTAGTGVTYHGYGRGDPPCAIDYILTRGFDCERVEKWTDCRDGVYLSDHYPVCAHIHPVKL